MSYLQTELVSHTRKVCKLYKEALRNLEAHTVHRHLFRYHAVHLRQRFEEKRDIKDMRVAKELLHLGQEELFYNTHPQPMKFPTSPGGVAHGRDVTTPDWVLDYWHPIEKAQYPEYFARREQRKKEYVEMWEKQYGKPEPNPDH